MRIGVVSDTHNHLKNVERIVELFVAAGVERVILSRSCRRSCCASERVILTP